MKLLLMQLLYFRFSFLMHVKRALYIDITFAIVEGSELGGSGSDSDLPIEGK